MSRNDISRTCSVVSGSGGQFIRQSTKGNKDRLVPLNSKALNILKEIRSYDNSNGFLFTVKGSDTPMGFRTYHDRYKAYFKAQQEKHPDLPYMTPHKLDTPTLRICFNVGQILKRFGACLDIQT